MQLIGGYRDALKFHLGQKITFSSDAFIESRPSSMQPFLRKMLQLQIFQQVSCVGNKIPVIITCIQFYLSETDIKNIHEPYLSDFVFCLLHDI